MKYAISANRRGFYMTKAGKDVTLIARNAHLAAMKEQTYGISGMNDGDSPVKTAGMKNRPPGSCEAGRDPRVREGILS